MRFFRVEAGGVNLRISLNTLAALSKAIVGEAINGRVQPSQARELASALSAAARVEQIAELESRLAALEQKYETTNQETRNGAWR